MIFTSEGFGGTRCQPGGCRHSPTEKRVSIRDAPESQEGWLQCRCLTGDILLLNGKSMDRCPGPGWIFPGHIFCHGMENFFSGREDKLPVPNRDESGVFHICPEKEKLKKERELPDYRIRTPGILSVTSSL